MTGATIKPVYPSTKPFLIRYTLYVHVAVVALVPWVIVLAAGIFLVFGQFTSVLRLLQIQSRDPLHPKGSKRSSQKED